MLRNSIRQMLRTPVRTVLFCVLLAVCVALMTLGVNLFSISRSTQKEAENAFVTLGMVKQKPSSMSMEEEWDPISQKYVQYAKEHYGEILSDEILDIEGLPYIHKPKHQPYYVAYTGDYVVRNTRSEVDESWLGIAGTSMIAEVEVSEDCVPDHPVELTVKKTLYGKRTEKNTGRIWFWDFYNPEPEKLYGGKTYIMAIYVAGQLEYLLEEMETQPEDYSYAVGEIWIPWMDNGGLQYTKDGQKIEKEGFTPQYYSEVTQDFYQTETGKRWLNLIRGFEIADYSIPVIPTDATCLQMYFYDGSAGIVDGRDITEEEYAKGEKVCLADQEFAANNHLKTGDFLRLPLYCADYTWAASIPYSRASQTTFTEKLINAEGELYEVFEDSEYEIVGIYRATGGDSFRGFEAARNGVIIPSDSVKNSDEENIVGYRPMQENNTIFQIENGKIDEFMEIWSKEGTDRLEITFKDNGYSRLEQSFQNTRRMSVILLGAGIGTAAFILLFFCHMFVTKQKLRIAIERCMGVTKRQCRSSVLSGILLVVLFGSIIGCSMGAAVTGKTAEQLNRDSGYSTMFSSNQAVEEERVSSMESLSGGHKNIILPIGTGLVFFVASWAVAGVMAQKILRKEPTKLLAEMKREF